MTGLASMIPPKDASALRVLFVGDIYGRPGRRAVADLVPRLRTSLTIDVVVANAENAAGGRGVSRRCAEQIFGAGVDVMTTGNHGFDCPEIFEFIDEDSRIVRACNIEPSNAPGRGYTVVKLPNKEPLAVVQANGRVFMHNCPCPFEAIDHVLGTLAGQGVRSILIDFHAEATSEKSAFGWHVAQRASAVIGTHTHVQTADEQVLCGHTAFISDVGMTGPYDSVIGADKQRVLRRFIHNERLHILVARDDVKLCAVVVDLDPATGRALSIRRLREDWHPPE